MSPFQATFGSEDSEYFKFNFDIGQKPTNFIKDLHKHMKIIRAITTDYQRQLIEERTAHNLPDEQYSKVQQGDRLLVLNRKPFKDYKIQPTYSGVYEVLEDQVSSDTHIQHIATGNTRTVHCSEVKMWYPSSTDDSPADQQALTAGEMESDQILVKRFVSHYGNILKRSDLTFEILFSNNKTEYIQFSNDIFQTIQYEQYIQSLGPEYIHLIFTTKDFELQRREMNSSPIGLAIGTTRYIRLQIWDYALFIKLKLPFEKGKDYFLQVITREYKNHTKTKIDIHVPILNKTRTVDTMFVHQFLQRETIDTNNMILIDDQYIIDNRIRLR
jgi:hypothetical protein